MAKRSPYNAYFSIPFVIWLISGALLMYFYTEQYLFAVVNTSYTKTLDMLMPLFTQLGEAVLMIVLSVLMMILFKRYRRPAFFLLILCATVLPALFTQSLKHYYESPRPLQVFQGQPWVHHLPQWDRLFHNSFPSGHTTGAFGFFSMLSLLVPSRYRYFGVLFFLLAMVTAYSRLYLAAHFFKDVYVGSFIGVTFSTLIYRIFRFFDKNGIFTLSSV